MYKEKAVQMIDGYFNLFGNSEREAKELENEFSNFNEYFNHVSHMEYKLPILQATLEGAELRDEIQRLDQHRRNLHNAAIASCNLFNVVAEKCGLEPFYEGNTEDRHEVAKFIGEFVTELYEVGIGERVPEKAQITDFQKDDKKADIIMNALKDENLKDKLPEGFSIQERETFSLNVKELYYKEEMVGKYYPSEDIFQMSAPYENLEKCIESIDNNTFGQTDSPEINFSDLNNERN